MVLDMMTYALISIASALSFVVVLLTVSPQVLQELNNQ